MKSGPSLGDVPPVVEVETRSGSDDATRSSPSVTRQSVLVTVATVAASRCPSALPESDV